MRVGKAPQAGQRSHAATVAQSCGQCHGVYREGEWGGLCVPKSPKGMARAENRSQRSHAATVA